MRKIIDTFGKYLVVALIMIAMFLFYTSVERKPLLPKTIPSLLRQWLYRMIMKTFRLSLT